MTDSPSPHLRLLACQPLIPETRRVAARDAHVRRLVDWLDDELRAAPADLVVLPELSTMEYSRAAFERLGELAEPLDGASFTAFSALARRHACAVCYGFARRAAEGFYISQAVLGADGRLLGCYDKIHLAQYGASMEREYFQRGGRVFAFELAGVRMAPLICYDIRIPEMSRALVLEHGVDLLLHCGAYYRDESFASWPAFAVTRAMENQVFLLSLNRAGANFGASMFCPPWVDEHVDVAVFPANNEACRRLSVDLAERDRTRRDYSFLADRLPRYE